MDTLVASTRAVKSGTTGDDSTYNRIEGNIEALTTERDSLATQIRAALEERRSPARP